MVSTILVNDFTKNERYYVALGSREDDKVRENWTKTDQLLAGLSNTTVFKDLLTWSELNPAHYQILILRNFVHLDQLSLVEKHDITNPAIESLYFLIACFIRSLLERANTDVEFLKITRLSQDRINFDYHASVTFELEPVERPLKVVVDNTKEA